MNFDYLYSDDKIVNISKYKFISTILHVLFLLEYQIPRCTCSELHFYCLSLPSEMSITCSSAGSPCCP